MHAGVFQIAEENFVTTHVVIISWLLQQRGRTTKQHFLGLASPPDLVQAKTGVQKPGARFGGSAAKAAANSQSARPLLLAHQVVQAQLQDFRAMLVFVLDRIQLRNRLCRHAEFGIAAGCAKLSFEVHAIENKQPACQKLCNRRNRHPRCDGAARRPAVGRRVTSRSTYIGTLHRYVAIESRCRGRSVCLGCSASRANLGSARASRAGDGAIAIANFSLSRTLRRGAAMGTRGRVRSPENTAMFVVVLNSGVCSLALGRSIDMFPQGNGYSRASSSLSRFSNTAIVLLIGSAVVMSTPASRNVSSGNFDPPDLRKPRYFSTAAASPLRTRWERVTAADSPVAYL